MPINYTVETRDGYLRVAIDGETDSPDELIACIDAVLAECGRSGCRNVMLDHRGLQFGRNAAGNYDAALKASGRLTSERPLRVALVARPERMEFAKIYEPIGFGRGTVIKAFDGPQMAAVWLAGGRKTALD